MNKIKKVRKEIVAHARSEFRRKGSSSFRDESIARTMCCSCALIRKASHSYVNILIPSVHPRPWTHRYLVLNNGSEWVPKRLGNRS